MPDTLETLRATILTLVRRKSALSAEGKNRLTLLVSNIGAYQLMLDVLDTQDERIFGVVRKLLLDDIALIEAELRDAKEE